MYNICVLPLVQFAVKMVAISGCFKCNRPELKVILGKTEVYFSFKRFWRQQSTVSSATFSVSQGCRASVLFPVINYKFTQHILYLHGPRRH